MIADTTFVSDLIQERRRDQAGPATQFFHAQRAQRIRLTIITAGEVWVLFQTSAAARYWLARWEIYPLHMGVVEAAGEIDRAMIASGRRSGRTTTGLPVLRATIVSRSSAGMWPLIGHRVCGDLPIESAALLGQLQGRRALLSRT
ncbi:MAG: hypothetical protein EBS05_03480 [Proteobacteria bacterium]|nr:hypothetical protein [Pseudomonadota bacterium]NDF01265.1 hypothetical protein [Verrucomicrobiota bacterium]